MSFAGGSAPPPDDQTQKASQLIERLLVDAQFRAAFRKDPVAACRQLGLDDLASEIGKGATKSMHTLEVRESKSSLAGVVMAVAAEGIGVVELHGLVEHGLLRGDMRAAGERALRGVNPMHPASSLHSELRGENPLSGASHNPLGAAERAQALAHEQSGGAASPGQQSGAASAAGQGGGASAAGQSGAAPGSGSAAAGTSGSNPTAGPAAAGGGGGSSAGGAAASTASPGGAASSASPGAAQAPSAATSSVHGAHPAGAGPAVPWPEEPPPAPATPGVAEVPGAGTPVVEPAAGTGAPVVEPGAAAAPAVVPSGGAGAPVVEPSAGTGAPVVEPAAASPVVEPGYAAGAPVAEPAVVGAPTVQPGAAGVYPAVAAPGSAAASAQELVASGAAGHAGVATAAAAVDPHWASPKAHGAFDVAKSELGVPYLWGGTSPKTGFDCSGLMQYAYGRVGIHIPRVAAEQFTVGTPVGLHQLREGDLVFFKESNGYIHHVGMYVGNDKFIQAPCTGEKVDYGDLRDPYFAQQFAGGRRIVPLSAPPAPAAPAPVAAAGGPAAFQAVSQPASSTAGAVPMAAAGAPPVGAVAEPAVVPSAAPSVPVEAGIAAPAAPGVPVEAGVGVPAAPGVPVEAAAPVVPVEAGTVPAGAQEIAPGVHLAAGPLPIEAPPQPGTAVFRALQAQESSYLHHTVKFLQAVQPPSAEPPATATPGVAAAAQGSPGTAAEVAGQSPGAGATADAAGAPSGEAAMASAPGVPGQAAAVEQIQSSGQVPGTAEVAGALDAASQGSIPYPGDSAPKGEIAQWMGDIAVKHGLPRELPVMASLVESSLHNDSFGDRDSLGYFQMRTSIWDKGEYAGFPRNPELQVKWFIDQALAVKNQMPDRHFGSDPANFGEWIDEIERPAEEYRGRYQLQLDTARELLGSG